jgi:lysozyme
MMEGLKPNLARQLKADEGLVLHAYQDSLGFWTIGYGRLIDDRRNGGINEQEAVYLLGNDIDAKLHDVSKALPWVPSMNEARQGALLNMAFQMGVGGLLGFQQTLAAIRDEHYAHAAHLMLLSTWAQQTPTRARKMSRQLETGEWQ